MTVWDGPNGEHGKSRHAFQSGADGGSSGSWPFFVTTSYAWERGQLLERNEYDAAGRSQRRITSSYRNRLYDQSGAEPVTTRLFRGMSMYSWPGIAQYDVNFFSGEYQVISAWLYQDAETTTVYDTTGTSSFSTTKTFAYANPNHAQVTEITEPNSDGTERITRMKYPADLALGSGDAEAVAFSGMQGIAHIHSPVVEEWVTKRTAGVDSVVSAELTSFKTYGASQYLPYQRFVLNSPSGVVNFTPSAVNGGVFTKDSRYLLQETADTYDGYGRISGVTDARGGASTYQYGGNLNNAFLIKVTRLGTGGSALDTDLAYDTDGFISSIKDEGGTFRHFTYDLFGRLRQIKNHSGTVVKAYGFAYSRTSPSWNFSAASPNAVVDTVFLQHSPTSRSVVSTQYLDGLGRPIQNVVRDGTSYVVSAAQYDAMGRIWRSWKPYSRTAGGYDESFVTNATSFHNSYHATSMAKPYTETSYSTDASSRVRRVTPPYIGTTATAFTVHGYGIDAGLKHEFREVTDELGKKTRSYADIFGNSVKTILGYGAAEATTTTFLSNVVGERIRATDPRGLATTYTIDTRGLVSAKISPDAGTATYKYDRSGNPRYAQDANQAAGGQVHFSTYDLFDRPMVSGQGAAVFSSLDPDAGTAPPLETTQSHWLVVRAYDAKPSTGSPPWSLFGTEIAPLTLSNTAGRLAAVASKSNGAWQAILLSYDTDGRVATRYTFTQANGGAAVLRAVNTSITYARDLRDAVTERWLTVGASTFNHWYDYDNRGLLWKVFASTGSAKPGTADVTYTYRPSGQLQDRQFAGGPLVPMRYGIREQLEKIGDPAGTLYPFSARYAYHGNGLISEAEFYNAGSLAAKRYRYQFPTYDALHRLKSADFSSWSGSSWTTASAHDLAGINYDASGNLTALQRRRETGTLIDNLTYSYSGSSNRLSSVSDAVGNTSESWDAETGSFSYDGNGNILTAPGPYSISSISYDHQNLPLSITRSGTTTAYRYDASGQRIIKQVGTGGTEVSLLDGSSSLGVVTVEATGAPSAWHFNVLAGDRVVGRQPDTGNRNYYHADLLGSTRAVVQGTTVIESNDLDPWGLPMPGRALSSGTKEIFTGKERDIETGLDYFGARYYMPAIGRWAAVDPLAEKYPEWSPYNYALNNPIGVVDPDGRIPVWVVGVFVGAGVEIGMQVMQMHSKGLSYGEALRAVDRSDVVTAALSGAVTGGLGSIQRIGMATKWAVSAGVSVAEGATKAHTGTDQTTYGAVEVATDLAAPLIAGKAAERAAQALRASTKGRTLNHAAKRAANIAKKGGARRTQTRTAEAARKRADQYGQGPTASGVESAATGIATSGGGDPAPPPVTQSPILKAPDGPPIPTIKARPPGAGTESI